VRGTSDLKAVQQYASFAAVVKPFALNAVESITDGFSLHAIVKWINNLMNGLKIRRCDSVLIARLILKKVKGAII